MYCSIDRIDVTAQVDGKPVVIQRDDRAAVAIAAEPELSALFAMARVLNARCHLAEEGHAGAVVHYHMIEAPPAELREALASVGALLEVPPRTVALGPASEAAASAIADRCFAELAHRTAARVGSRDLAIALRMLEDQTTTAPPARGDEVAYWSRVLELASLAGELLRAKYPGSWVQTDRALVPFGFQLATGGAVMFPTNRAQRVIEDGRDETLFKLLLAADETVRHPSDTATGRLMPSLRARRDVQLEEVVWRPIVADEAPHDLPIIVCGIDGESTFGMIRREALAKSPELALAEALRNLAEEDVDCEHLELGELPIAFVSGSFYAAEKVLDREFMCRLHEVFDAKLLVVATPARGELLVAPVGDQAALAQFSALAHHRHGEAGGRAISPAMMLVGDGRVNGYVRGPDDKEEPPANELRAETAPGMPGKRGFLRRWLGRK